MQIAALTALASSAIAVGALATVEIIPVKAPLVFGPVLMGLGVILLVTDVAQGLKAAGRFSPQEECGGTCAHSPPFSNGP